jgi:hypothetical protein
VRDWRPGGLVCTVELPLERALAGRPLLRPIKTGLEPDFALRDGAGLPPSRGARASARPREAAGREEALAAASASPLRPVVGADMRANS